MKWFVGLVWIFILERVAPGRFIYLVRLASVAVDLLVSVPKRPFLTLRAPRCPYYARGSFCTDRAISPEPPSCNAEQHPLASREHLSASKLKMSNSNQVREFSCYACRQRKVKCDRHEPCANCVRADADCQYIEPTRGKRKRTKPLRESLHAKIARYERMLEKHGENLTPSLDDGQSSEEESVVETPATQAELTSRRHDASAPYPQTQTQTISAEPSSRYFDR